MLFFFFKKEQMSEELLPSVMFLVPGSPHMGLEKGNRSWAHTMQLLDVETQQKPGPEVMRLA